MFHHRYHFVPPSKKDPPGNISLKDWHAGSRGRATHAIWGNTTEGAPDQVFCGRLICTLLTESLVVVGARQARTPNKPTQVSPFEIQGQPAIPGSSLRGLISSIAEAASNSTLRILSDPPPEKRDHGGERPALKQPLHSPSDFFAGINPNLVPLGRTKERTLLSIAELLFGFVGDTDQIENQRIAFASRIRFSNAITTAESPYAWNQFETMRAMRSPNPLSVSLYFSDSSNPGSKLSVKTLNIANHRVQGRKFYLHWKEPNAFIDATNVKDRKEVESSKRNPDWHLKAKPLRKGVTFTFHIDFENLSQLELGLLCYALVPAPEFRHKLGLGKPFGIGQVKIGRLGIFFIDRVARYLTDMPAESGRYHRVWLPEKATPAHLPDRYEYEKQAASEFRDGRLPAAQSPIDFAESFRKEMDAIAPEIPGAVEQLGNPANVVEPLIRYLVPSQEHRGLPPLSGVPTDPLPRL